MPDQRHVPHNINDRRRLCKEFGCQCDIAGLTRNKESRQHEWRLAAELPLTFIQDARCGRPLPRLRDAAKPGHTQRKITRLRGAGLVVRSCELAFFASRVAQARQIAMTLEPVGMLPDAVAEYRFGGITLILGGQCRGHATPCIQIVGRQLQAMTKLLHRGEAGEITTLCVRGGRRSVPIIQRGGLAEGVRCFAFALFLVIRKPE